MRAVEISGEGDCELDVVGPVVQVCHRTGRRFSFPAGCLRGKAQRGARVTVQWSEVTISIDHRYVPFVELLISFGIVVFFRKTFDDFESYQQFDSKLKEMWERR